MAETLKGEIWHVIIQVLADINLHSEPSLAMLLKWINNGGVEVDDIIAITNHSHWKQGDGLYLLRKEWQEQFISLNVAANA